MVDSPNCCRMTKTKMTSMMLQRLLRVARGRIGRKERKKSYIKNQIGKPEADTTK